MAKFIGYPFPLGVSEFGDYVNFSVAMPGESDCKLMLYRKDFEVPELEISMLEDELTGDLRYIGLPKNKVRGREYAYKVDGQIVLDPYAKEICGQTEQPRGKVLLDKFDWEGDAPLHLPLSEVIAYGLHVKGFTAHKSSKVSGKGTLKGVIEKLPYLLELGINQIQLMPVYSFDKGEGYINYWGYGPGYFFAPNKEYSSLKSAVRQLKELVKTYHKSGVEVVLYMPFDASANEQEMLDCLRYYAMEYHIDGFIVNSSLLDINMLRKDPILNNCKILEMKDHYQMEMRRFLHGDKNMAESLMWWSRQITEEIGSCNYMAAHNGFTLIDSLSYNHKHNEANGEQNQDGPEYNCSYNYGAEGVTRKPKVKWARKRQMKNAFFLLMTSQGTPCILAGDEFANTQMGNNNAYCQDNEISWLDWKQCKKEEELLSFVKNLVTLRKQYPILHQKEAFICKDVVGCGVPDVSYHSELAWQLPKGKNIGVYYHNENEEIADCFVAYNMNKEEKIFALPALARGKKWELVLTTAEKDLNVDQRTFTLEEYSAAIFIGK